MHMRQKSKESLMETPAAITPATARPGKLTPVIERFVLHWGEMGTHWGVNRSVAQIHALLYVSASPLTAEEISETLGLARSNVSNSIKELLGWQLIRRVHVMGDRRDHFEAEADLWQMLMNIAEGRKKREIDPTLEIMDLCVKEAEADRSVTKLECERIIAMNNFVTTMDNWYTDMASVPKGKIIAMMKMGKAIMKFVSGGKK